MSKSTVEVQKVEYNGAPARGADRAGPVEVLHNSETGRTEVLTQGGGPRPSRTAVIERAKERAAAARATGGAPAPAATESDEDDAVGSGPAGDEVPVEGEQAGEPGEPAAEPAAEPEASAEPTRADPGADYDRVQAQLEELQREREQQQVGDFEAFADDPVKSHRRDIARRYGVAEDDAVVDEELDHIAEELTWGRIPAQDIPSDKKAQLEMARWRRQQRLDKYRRKADQEKTTRHDGEKRLLDQARRSFESVKDAHPHLALAAELDGRSVEEIVTSTMRRALDAGVLTLDMKTDAAFKEAIRLAEIQSHQSLTRKAKLLAHLATAPAPIKPGASSKTQATAQQPSSPAASKTPSPRALTAAKAGAAPSRPAEPAPTQPKRKVVDASAYEDPSDRRADVLKRHTRRT